MRSAPGEAGELENMLSPKIKVHRLSNAQKPTGHDDNGGVCLMTESPFRILRVSLNGNESSYYIHIVNTKN